MKKVLAISIICSSLSCTVHGQELINKLEHFECPFELNNSVEGTEIKAEALNSLLKFKGEVYYYSLDGQKRDDGVASVRMDSIILNSVNDEFEPIQITKFNKFRIIGIIDINPDYITIAIQDDTFESLNISLLNLTKEFVILSSIRFTENQKGTEDNLIYQITNSFINKDCIIHQVTRADFMISRKFVIDSDGHFRVIEEEIKDM